MVPLFLFFFEKNILFISRERGGEGERGRKTSTNGCLSHLPLGTWPTTQAHALTRSQTGDFSVHGAMPDPLSHPSQGGKQNFRRNTLPHLHFSAAVVCVHG